MFSVYSNGNQHEPETDLSERSVSPALSRSSRYSGISRQTSRTKRYNHAAKIKSLDDFSVRTPAGSVLTPATTSPVVSPSSTRCSTPDGGSKPKMKISDLVAQRFARLTKKLDEEEEQERIAALERESKRHIRRGSNARSVMEKAPGQLARVSIVEVSFVC